MENEKRGLNIGIKSFVTAIVILFVLMIGTYILTFVVPSGTYERVMEDGQQVVVPGTYAETEGGVSFVKWLLSPVLVLGAEGSGTIIAIIVFLLIIGGTFSALDHSGILKYMLEKISSRYRDKKYRLLCAVSLFFMALGSLVGSFEECVPLVPIAIALALSMGWDTMVGLGMSLLAVGCGFSTGICNPFTVGVAQELAGLPMFSGLSFRILSFVVIYIILISFLTLYAKKVERTNLNNVSLQEVLFCKNENMEKGLRFFVCILGTGIALIFASSFIPFLQGIIMPLIALIFLLAGIFSVISSGVEAKTYLGHFKDGMVSILPAVLLILMASSIKYIMTEAKIMDTMLYKAMGFVENTSPSTAILWIYLIVLVLNFFIASGSAKAFLLMPLIVPLADLAGISRQLCVLAFAYGDGFSNIFYPTNPVLLISLGLAGVNYGKWVRFSCKIQSVILVATGVLLVIAYHAGY